MHMIVRRRTLTTSSNIIARKGCTISIPLGSCVKRKAHREPHGEDIRHSNVMEVLVEQARFTFAPLGICKDSLHVCRTLPTTLKSYVRLVLCSCRRSRKGRLASVRAKTVRTRATAQYAIHAKDRTDLLSDAVKGTVPFNQSPRIYLLVWLLNV